MSCAYIVDRCYWVLTELVATLGSYTVHTNRMFIVQGVWVWVLDKGGANGVVTWCSFGSIWLLWGILSIWLGESHY